MTLFKRNSSRSDTHHVNLILFNQIRSFKFSMSFIIGMMLLVCGVGSVKGTAKKWNGGNSGNWNTDNHWSPNGVPGAADDVTIDISASISVDINPTINSLTINNPTVSLKSSGGTRTITINNTNNIITSGSSLTLIGSTGTRGGARPMNIAFTGTNNTMLIAGTLTLNASGGGSSYDATNSLTTVSGSIKNDGSAGGTDGTITSTAANLSFLSGGTYEHALDGGTIPTANWNAASTCLISGITNAVPTVESFAQSFGNFTWDCATQTSGISLIGNLSNINGNFTITNTNTGSLRLANGSVTGTLNVGGNFNQSAGTFYICGTTNSCTITMSVGGSFSLSNGTFNFSGSSGIGTVAVAGNFSNTSGTMTESGSGTGAVIFNGSTQQFYISGGTVSETINFTVNNGAILQMATSGTIVSGKGTFTVANGGTLGVTSQYGITQSETANPGNIAVTGIRTYNAGANYIYNGTTAQVTGNGLTGANNLIINNANGVTLSAPTSVSGFLNLTNGILTSNATNLLSITNTLNSGISGGSSTSFINGPVKWTLPINFSGTSYNFPTGNGTTYLPFTLNNLATGSGAISAQVQAFLGNSGGSVDGTLSSISTSEYWSLTTSGNFTNSSVSLSRPSAITPNDMIGGSVALAGPYTSLVGTPGTNTVSNSAIINNNRFFVFAQSKSITTGTITGSPFCAGSAVSIPYTIAGTYISGNVFTAQLSGPTGSFTTPVTIGTLTSTSAGTILGTIPAVTSTGTSYRIRVVSSTPSSVIGTNNGSDLIINSNTISAPATTGASGCIGTSSSLTAAGATSGYVYKWYDAPMGGNVIKTSTNNSDNTFPTPVLYSTTSYWVSIKDPSGCEGPRTQATATYPTICTDNQTAGANSWIGYIYSGFDTNFANNIYFGHYALAETFNENFGNGEDNYCFPITSNSTPISINTKNFSVRYLMNSNRKGLFAVDLGSDDGSRLTIDNTPIYNNWSDQTYSARSSVLINLTGSSSLIYDYYENAGQNQVAFQNLNQIIANNLTNNISQSIYTGISGTTISGDVFGTLPSGISLSGTGYQWTYSTSLSGTRIIIPGATGATYTPTATLAPFNTPGTYYLYRNAVLSSTNNVSPTTYMATNESNVAMLIVNTLSTANGIVTNSSCPLVADGGISLIKPVDNAVQFNYVTNDYIDLGSSLLNNLSAFTIEGWIKYKSSDFGTKTRIGLFGQNDAIELGIISSTDIQCYTSSNHSLDVTITATTLGDNKWHHIATVGNSTSITIYIDGVSKGSTPPFTSISSFGSSSDHASIGQVFDVAGKTNQTFPGQIRRVGFWNRSLSSAEITSLATTYTNFYTGSETGLIAGYNFTEGTGTTISSLFSSGGTVHTGSFVYSPNWADLLSYSWSNTSQTTRNISGLLMGTYTLTPTYGNSTTGTAEPFTVVSNNTCATNWKGTYSSVWNDKTLFLTLIH